MRRTLLAFLFLAVCGASLNAQTVIVSQAAGNWSNTATWAGGVVPGDGSYVVVKHAVVINQNIGTAGGGGIKWIRQEATGLTVASGASYTITFASTGTNPIGSGATGNPGADATMFGFFVSKGTFDLEGSSANQLTITSANGTSPVYIHHGFVDFIGCTTITANVCNGSATAGTASLTVKYADIGPVVGTATSGYEGIKVELNNGTETLNLQNSILRSLNQIVFTSSGNNSTISNNYFLNPTNAHTVQSGGNNETGWTVTNNTEVGATVAGQFFYTTGYFTGLTFTGNAVLGTASITRGLLQFAVGNGSGHTINGNFCFDPANGTLPNIQCINYNAAASDTTTTISLNVLVGSYQNIDLNLGSPTVLGNWLQGHSDQTAGQGPIIAFGASGQGAPNTFTVASNTVTLDSSSGNLVGLFFTTNATSANWNIFLLKQNTFIGTGNSLGTYLAEGGASASQAIQLGYFRSSIAVGGAVGITDGDINSTWSASNRVNSAAVHHNLTFSHSTGDYAKVGTSWSSGFDNGTVRHPDSSYGDLTVDPRFINASATPATFDSWCGGPGTAADLFTNLSHQVGFGGTYAANCGIAAMLAYLQNAFTPMNGLLKNAGAPSDCPTACDVGSVPVYSAAAMVIP